MSESKPMPLLLVEDDENECNKYASCIKSRDDVKLIKTTKSSTEAIELVKMHMPEGIILDIELHDGEGSGLEFLENLNKSKLEFRPLIAIITNIKSKIIYSHAYQNGADLIYYKNQSDYSAEKVVKTLLTLRKTLKNNKYGDIISNIETPAERESKIAERIDASLTLIGIGSHLKGRKYLYDAIEYLIENNPKNEDTPSAFDYLSNKYIRTASSISRVMQTAINHAWRISAIEDLEIYYTARVNHEKGVPTPTEFVYHYADKIRKEL